MLSEEKSNLRLTRRAVDNIFVINVLLERKKREGGTLYLVFLEMETTYDRVNRKILCRVLEKVGLSDNIVIIISSIYVGTREKCRLENLDMLNEE